MDSSLIADLVKIGTSIAKMLPGAAPLVEAARGVIDLVDKIQDTAELPSAEISQLRGMRDELERRVNAHADQTIGRLNG